MGKLSDVLLSATNRPKVIQDCVRLIDDEVGRKSGLSGIAIKGGYAIFKKVKPTATEDAMDALLNEFVEKLDPTYEEYKATGQSKTLEQFLSANGTRIANTLLEITDKRAVNSPNAMIKGAYQKLRPMAEKQVVEALPGVARMLMRYV